jgi:hypothetical protein
MIEINLLPDVKQEFLRTQAQKRLVVSSMIIVSIAAGIVVVLLIFVAYVVQPGLRLLSETDIKTKSSQLQSDKNLPRDLTIQNQLSTISQLHQEKGVYDRFFDYFTSLNPEVPNNISISDATIDAVGGTISIEASAADYQAIAVFQDTLKNAQLNYVDSDGNSQKTPLFTDISISEAGLGQDSKGAEIASFKADLTYDPNAFSWTAENPSVSVPNKSTTPTASQVSNQTSVFSDTPAQKTGSQ